MLLNSRIFWAQLGILSAIAMVHVLAINHDWYWYYLWLDVPVHFFAGTWVALATTWLFATWKRGTRAPVIVVFLTVLFVGLSWEVFEVLGGISMGQPNYVFDTSLDVLMDMLGGLLGIALARRFLLPRV